MFSTTENARVSETKEGILGVKVGFEPFSEGNIKVNLSNI